MSEQKVIRIPEEMLKRIDALCEQYNVDRRLFLNAAIYMMKQIMNRSAEMVVIDGESVEVPLDFRK